MYEACTSFRELIDRHAQPNQNAQKELLSCRPSVRRLSSLSLHC